MQITLAFVKLRKKKKTTDQNRKCGILLLTLKKWRKMLKAKEYRNIRSSWMKRARNRATEILKKELMFC